MRVLRPPVAAAAALLIVSVVGVAGPAYADEASPSIDDATAVLESVAPSIVAETSDDAHLAISETGTAPTVALATPDSPLPENTSPGVTFSVDYATAVTDSEEGLTVLSAGQSSVAAYVQPTAFGVRVMTAIADDSAPSSYNYTFDVPEGTQLVEGDAAYYLEHGDDVLGTVFKPWATDAAGNSVATSYTWDNGVLTQHVDLSASSIDFPVVADPAWGYTYYYGVTKSAAQNSALLKRCFNCYFPVAGAPRQFPHPGQLLPLTVSLGIPRNFECRFAREFTSGTEYFGFQFNATKNHVDGLGSNIVFEFRPVNGKRKLVVGAYIANSSWPVNSGYYRLGAALNWQNFANNLNRG